MPELRPRPWHARPVAIPSNARTMRAKRLISFSFGSGPGFVPGSIDGRKGPARALSRIPLHGPGEGCRESRGVRQGTWGQVASRTRRHVPARLSRRRRGARLVPSPMNTLAPRSPFSPAVSSAGSGARRPSCSPPAPRSSRAARRERARLGAARPRRRARTRYRRLPHSARAAAAAVVAPLALFGGVLHVLHARWDGLGRTDVTGLLLFPAAALLAAAGAAALLRRSRRGRAVASCARCDRRRRRGARAVRGRAGRVPRCGSPGSRASRSRTRSRSPHTDVTFRAADGVRLSGWYVPVAERRRGRARPRRRR